MSLRSCRKSLAGLVFAASLLSGIVPALAWEGDGPDWHPDRRHHGWHEGRPIGWQPDFGFRPPPRVYYAPPEAYRPPPPPPAYYWGSAYVPY